MCICCKLWLCWSGVILSTGLRQINPACGCCYPKINNGWYTILETWCVWKFVLQQICSFISAHCEITPPTRLEEHAARDKGRCAAAVGAGFSSRCQRPRKERSDTRPALFVTPLVLSKHTRCFQTISSLHPSSFSLFSRLSQRQPGRVSVSMVTTPAPGGSPGCKSEV